MTNTNPITQFIRWFEEAKTLKELKEPTAMCLATCDSKGQPSARMILLKGIDERGFVFYTNIESRKAADLHVNPKAALCFYWMPLGRQVRVEGSVSPVTNEEADAYFASRSRESRIGAWASHQSHPLVSRAKLIEGVAAYNVYFDGQEVERPPFWVGWRLAPQAIEFWQEGKARLHDRDLYTRAGDGWAHTKLYP